MAQESVVRGSLAGPQTGATTSFGSKFWPAPCSRETGAREVSIVAAGCFTSRAAAGQPRAACARTDLQTLNRRPTRSALCSRFSAPSRPRCTSWVRRPPFRLDPPGAIGLLFPPPFPPLRGLCRLLAGIRRVRALGMLKRLHSPGRLYLLDPSIAASS
jgi:hypothetical protein